jgi:hypothetical protein
MVIAVLGVCSVFVGDALTTLFGGCLNDW